MKKKHRNKRARRINHSLVEPINLPFTVESFHILVEAGLTPGKSYTHQQIADWAYRFWWECTEGSLSEVQDPLLERVVEIALDLHAQWELYLVNSYAIEQLRRMDFAMVELPREWFEEWRRKIPYTAKE